MKIFAVRGLNTSSYTKLYPLSLFLLLLCIQPASAQDLLQRRVTIEQQGVPLSAALRAIGKLVGCTFVYSNQLLQADRPVSFSYVDKPLGEILEEELGTLADGLRVMDDQIYIRTPQKGLLEIKGNISDTEGNPLAGVSIRIKGSGRGTYSDQQGNYRITELLAQSYTLIVSSMGYQTQEKLIQLRDDRPVDVDFVLKTDNRQLQQVTVVGKSEIQQLRESGFHVTAIDAQQYANSNVDINQILNRSTGIRIRESGGLGSDFTFSINGISGRHIRFFIDGIPMENMGQAYNLNNFPANLVERIEVYKGVVPGSLGSDALGGAVNIVTNRSTKHFVDASYSYGSFNTHRSAVVTRFNDKLRGISVLAKGFFNYSDNNYIMRNNPKHNVFIEVAEEGKWITKDGLKRFNDRYKSGMGQVEVAVMNKKWADHLSAGFSYAGYDKQLQTGASVTTVYGGYYTTGYTLSPSVAYAKADFLAKGLSVTLNSSMGFDDYSVRDTASYPYDWSGHYIRPLPPHKEKKTGYQYTNRSLLARANADYSLNERHTITATYNANSSIRHSENELDPGYDMGPDNHLQKHILGLSMNSSFMDGKLSNNLFAKYYGVNASKSIITKTDYVKDEEGNYKAVNHFERKRDYSAYYGYGIASRYRVMPNLGVKASFERAYRLLDANELFGDGLFYLGNDALIPESSYNLNLGVFYAIQRGHHALSMDAAAFYRDARDFIYNRTVRGVNRQTNETSDYMQPYNAGKVRITGAEAELKYGYKDLVSLKINASYQDAIDNRRFNDGVTAYESITYRNRIPNQPWLFGNTEVIVGRDGLLGKRTRLQLDWYTQYIHWFYLNWEAFGSKASKNTIPTQLIHSASLTASWMDGKYNISLESHNLGNEIAYDNFRLQKAGRAVYAKFRCLIQ